MPLLSASAGDYPTKYNDFLTTTVQAYRKTLVDNISEATPLFWWLNQKGRKKFQSGGESIVQPLMYALPSVQRFSGYDTLSTAPHDGIAPAVFTWKHYTVPIVISKEHLQGNMGEAAILNLLEAETKKAEIGLTDAMNYDMAANGADGDTFTATPDVRGITGMPDLCQDTDQGRVYGGIDPAVHTWWANSFKDVGGAFGTASAGVNAMRDLFFSCSRGQDQPELLLCGEDVYKAYEISQVGNKTYVNTLAADAGFTNLAYRGSVMMFDRDVHGGYIYMLNSKYIQLVVDPAVDFTVTPFVDADQVPDGQWAVFARIFWRGNLTCSNRKRQGLLYGCTDSWG